MTVAGCFQQAQTYVSTAATYAGLQISSLISGQRGRLYCIGTAKSGTHSIAEMFSPPIRSQHEIHHRRLIRMVCGVSSGKLSPEKLRQRLRRRDRMLMLQVDSSHMNFFILDQLLSEFPGARFVLTMRDCYSWVNSMMKHSLVYTAPHPEWQQFRDFRFKLDGHPHAPEEQKLKELGLYTLDGYLSYWARHNETALAKVPAERLMIVRTEKISTQARDIARFASLPEHLVRPQRAHAFANPDKSSLLHTLPREFVEEKVEKHCRPLMSRFFPEISSLDDAKLQ
jgi:hypothetical protein